MKQPNLLSTQVCSEYNWIEIQSLALCLQSDARSVSPVSSCKLGRSRSGATLRCCIAGAQALCKARDGSWITQSWKEKNMLKWDSWGESDIHPGQCVVGGEAESWACSACRRDGSVCINAWGDGVGDTGPGLLSSTRWQGKRQQAQTKIQEVLFERNKFLCCKGGETLQRFAQSGCGVSPSLERVKTWCWTSCHGWPCTEEGFGWVPVRPQLFCDFTRSRCTSTACTSKPEDSLSGHCVKCCYRATGSVSSHVRQILV